MDDKIKNLVGKTIKRIFFNENYLRFDTDDGNFTFNVEGDCCSRSYFYDFYGVKNLLENGKVLEVKEVELEPKDIIEQGKDDFGNNKDKKYSDEDIQVYGYQLTTESPKFGTVTSVFSFRNYSNGYYGGWMEECENIKVEPEIFDDVIVTEGRELED